MMIRILLGVIALIALFYVYNRWRRLPPEQRRGSLWKFLIYGALIACVIAVATGRLHWLGAVFAGGLALLKFGASTLLRTLPFLNVLRRSPFIGKPQFKTQFIDVNLDLQSGRIQGNVIKGPHEGKTLDELDDDALVELEQYYSQHHKSSMLLIRAYRQQRGFNQQRENDHASTHNTGDRPSFDEALQILGLSPSFSQSDLKRAHRSLMQKLHPDRGGNHYLASRVNLAKEVLLEHLQRDEH